MTFRIWHRRVKGRGYLRELLYAGYRFSRIVLFTHAYTQVVNDTFLQHVRAGRIEYIQCETVRYTRVGIVVKPRKGGTWEGTTKGAPLRTKDESKEGSRRPRGKDEAEILADFVVLATGFKRPGVEFLPEDLFPEGYEVSVKRNRARAT